MEKIEILERRLEWLRTRIFDGLRTCSACDKLVEEVPATAKWTCPGCGEYQGGKNLSFDKKEAEALEWALDMIKDHEEQGELLDDIREEVLESLDCEGGDSTIGCDDLNSCLRCYLLDLIDGGV